MNNHENSCDSYQQWSRRALIKRTLSGVAAMALGQTALSQIALHPEKTAQKSLIVVFLRGGADGLSMVVPYGEDEYYRLRPNIAISAPKKGAVADRVIDIDGFFGLHPQFSALEGLYKDGKMAVVHAVGSGDSTGSHFEAMAAMERGLYQNGSASSRTNGWLARYLNATAMPQDSPLRAVSLTDYMPDSLLGATNAMNLSELAQFELKGSKNFRNSLAKAYAKGDDPMTHSGRETLRLLDTLEKLDYKKYKASGKANYPDTGLGAGLRQVAFLIKAGAGLEVALLDHGGYDTHIVQGVGLGWLGSLLSDLSLSIKAISDDLGEKMTRTTIVVMTEFGRRAYENGGLGTDHGRASVMLTIGGNVKGGNVFGDWPTLKPDTLSGPGDLKVTTDYRSVLREVLTHQMGLSRPDIVFPGVDKMAASLF